MNHIYIERQRESLREAHRPLLRGLREGRVVEQLQDVEDEQAGRA